VSGRKAAVVDPGGTAIAGELPWSLVLILALDTATPTLVAGVARWSAGEVEVLAEEARSSGTRHAELLTPAIQAALSGAGVAMGGIEGVVVGLGPGPFTGLRVGVVTAAALGDARGLPVVGVCSLDAVGDGERTVVTDARRREVYWARYRPSGDRIDGPGVARPEGFAVPGPYVGDPAFADRLGAPVAEAAVTTAGLLRAAAAQLTDPASAGSLVPLYLRRPDAVPPTSSKAVTPT
jgi:tRNA threonylcarbamoyl adenosine modification protein YeaZ